MSPELVFHRWLSLRSWLLGTVLPSALALVAMLALLRAIGPSRDTLDHTSVMVGFAALYFMLFRGGHMLMIRSLHAEMMRKHEVAYRDRLSMIGEGELKRRNLGFTLARLKRDILIDAHEEKRRARDRLTGRD
ncbi:MAG: hypothetical protein AAF311_15715 [Pseudomonadota bacterium]